MKNFETIDQYIASYPENVQEVLQKIRKTIKAAAPGAEEAMRYGIPTFRLNDQNLVHFGGFKTHIGFYPAPSGIEQFKKELAQYQAGKGTIQFPLNQSIPYDLVTQIVKFRVEENQKKISKS